MANLYYRVEYLKDEANPSNESVYIQLRQSPAASDWFDRTRKQDYEGGTSTLGDTLFTVAGVTELAIQPFRIWLSKSPVYTWYEVILPIVFAAATNLSLDAPIEMSGSPIYLLTEKDRLEP